MFQQKQVKIEERRLEEFSEEKAKRLIQKVGMELTDFLIPVYGIVRSYERRCEVDEELVRIGRVITNEERERYNQVRRKIERKGMQTQGVVGWYQVALSTLMTYTGYKLTVYFLEQIN